MKAVVQRAMLSVVIAPMAVAFFLIACTMAGPREAAKILKWRGGGAGRPDAAPK